MKKATVFFKTNWPDLLLSVAAGILLTVSSPGVDLWPAAFAAFILIFWICDRGRIKGWLSFFITGLVFYAVALSWVSVPITLFGGAPGWIGALIALLLALISAVIFWLPVGFVMDKTKSTVLVALVIVILELAKGKYYLGGLPWLNIAQTQQTNIMALQFVSVAGEHGLSFLVILISGYIYKFIKDRRIKDFGIAASLSALMFGYGAVSMVLNKLPEPEYTARMVQTGILQEEKWDRSKTADVKNQIVQGVSKAAAIEGDYDIMILPESSFNVPAFEDETVSKLINEVSLKRPLIFSFDRAVQYDSGTRFYNSAGLMAGGVITQQYDKMKLAPFGEYFPMEKYLKPIKEYFFGSTPMFTPGNEPVVFTHEGLRMAPLLCFEASFSELMAERIKMGANVFITMSNESWFGQSLGRSQRLAMDTIHSVEYGRYMIRTTQDGITALINPFGQKEAVLPEKVYSSMDARFSVMNHLTLFARFGYSWYVIIIVIYAFELVRRRKSANSAGS